METPEIIIDDDSDGEEENYTIDVCVLCAMKIRATDLECHISSKHLGYYPFCCQACDMRFPSKSQLIHHAMEDHSLFPPVLEIRCDLNKVKHMKLKKMVLASRSTKLTSETNNKSAMSHKTIGITTEFLESPAKKAATISHSTVFNNSEAVGDSPGCGIIKSEPTNIIPSSPPNINPTNVSMISPSFADSSPILSPHPQIKTEPNCENSATSCQSNWPNELSDVKAPDFGVQANLLAQPNVPPKPENDVPVAEIVSVEMCVSTEILGLLMTNNAIKIKLLERQLDCEIIVPPFWAVSIQPCILRGREKNVYIAQKKIEGMENEWKQRQCPIFRPQISRNISQCELNLGRNRKRSHDCGVQRDVGNYSGQCNKGNKRQRSKKYSDRDRPSPNMNITQNRQTSIKSPIISETVIISEVQWKSKTRKGRQRCKAFILKNTKVIAEFITAPQKGCVFKGKSSDIKLAKSILKGSFDYGSK